MNLMSGQSAPLETPRPGGEAGATPASPSALFPGRPEAPFFRLDVRRSLQMHWRLTLALSLAGLALACAYVALKWPLYVAESRVFIQPSLPQVMAQGSTSTANWPNDSSAYDSFVQQQVQSAAHPEVLLSALHKLPAGSWQRANENEQAAALRLGHSTKVVRPGTSFQLTVTAQASSADQAAQIANALAGAIVENAAREEKAGNADRLAVLKAERERVVKDLDADLAEQEKLNAELGMAGIGATLPDHYDDDIGRVHEELIKARTAHSESAARLNSVDAAQAPSSAALDAEAEEIIASDPGLVSMKTSLNQRRAVLIAQMANLTPNHPEYKQHAEELAKIDASLDAMMKDLRAKAAARIQQRLRTDLGRAAEVEGRLNAQLGHLTGAAAAATPKMQRASALAADIARLQGRYSNVDEQLHNVILEMNAPGAAHLFTAALPPLHPAIMQIARVALPIGFGGIVFGLMAALIASNLDQKIYVAGDVERVLGFAPMAQLPDFAEVSGEVAEEHLLRLSTSIGHAWQSGTLKSCLFTGSAPHSGVTTIVTRVTSMLDTMGIPSVQVDASGTQVAASSSPAMGPSESGLVQAPRGRRPTALLQELAEQAEGEKNLVLTDAAPLPISAETEYLARFVDAAVLVVESGVTTAAQLRELARTLQRLDVAAAGIVLNRVRVKNADPPYLRLLQMMEKRLQSSHGASARRAKNDLSLGLSRAATGRAPLPERTEEQRAENTVKPAAAEKPAQPGPPAALPQSPREPAAAPVAPRLPQRSNEEILRQAVAGLPPRGRVAEPIPSAAHARPQEPMVREQPQEWPVAAEDPVRAAAAENANEEPDRPASRLSGFWNADLATRLKKLNKRDAAAEPEEDLPAQNFEQVSGRTPFVRRPVPEPATAARTIAPDADRAVVTAAPEILPPKPAEEEKEEESKHRGRFDRRDAYDDIEILPSRRGQYRRV